MNSVKTTTPIKPNRKKENIKKSILFADALMSQLLINQSSDPPNRPLYYPFLMHGNLTSELKEYSQNQDQTNTILKQFTQVIINNYEFIQSLINNECDLYIKLPISNNHETSEKKDNPTEKDNPAEFISIGKSKYIMFDKENGSNIIRKYKPIEHADVVDLLYVDSDEKGSEIILYILSADVNDLELYYVNPVSKQSALQLEPIYPKIQIYTLYKKTPGNTAGRGTTQKKRKTKNTNQKRKKTRKRHKLTYLALFVRTPNRGTRVGVR